MSPAQHSITEGGGGGFSVAFIAIGKHKTSAFLLEQDIIAVPVAPPIEVNRQGWAKAGTVSDGIEGQILDVWWHPATDRVRGARPKPYAPSAPPEEIGNPLYRTTPASPESKHQPFTARPGYIYSFQGRAYSADEAEVETARLASLDGWTWEPDRT